MIKNALVIGLLSVSFASWSNQTANEPGAIPAFQADYDIIHNDKTVGSAKRTLVYQSDTRASFSYETQIKWLIFSDQRMETTEFDISGHKISPIAYQFTREGTGRDKAFKWQYDSQTGLIKNLVNNKSRRIEWPAGLQDNLSYHLQNRLTLRANPEQKTFVYPVINKDGNVKNLVYQYDGMEKITIPYGTIDAIRLKREVVEKKRVTYAWFAPELDYLLVKLYQEKDGDEQFEAQLTKVTALSRP